MRAEYKVPNGKLVAADAEVKDGRLTRVTISGDFFMHPEPEIVNLEKALLGARVEELDATVNRFVSSRSIQLFGIAPGDFAHVIRLSLASKPSPQGSGGGSSRSLGA